MLSSQLVSPESGVPGVLNGPGEAECGPGGPDAHYEQKEQ